MIKIQTGIRIDKKLLKVIKGLAEKKEQSLAHLVEQILAKSLLGLVAIDPEDQNTIHKLCEIYCMELDELRVLAENNTQGEES